VTNVKCYQCSFGFDDINNYGTNVHYNEVVREAAIEAPIPYRHPNMPVPEGEVQPLLPAYAVQDSTVPVRLLLYIIIIYDKVNSLYNSFDQMSVWPNGCGSNVRRPNIYIWAKRLVTCM
jgi:hypothetical protein